MNNLEVHISFKLSQNQWGEKNQIITFYESKLKAFVWRFSTVDDFWQVTKTQVRD